MWITVVVMKRSPPDLGVWVPWILALDVMYWVKAEGNRKAGFHLEYTVWWWWGYGGVIG